VTLPQATTRMGDGLTIERPAGHATRRREGSLVRTFVFDN
jgi:hypothetical protein